MTLEAILNAYQYRRCTTRLCLEAVKAAWLEGKGTSHDKAQQYEVTARWRSRYLAKVKRDGKTVILGRKT